MSPSGGMYIPQTLTLELQPMNYKKNIYSYLSQQRALLIKEALAIGITEQAIEDLLNLENVNDLQLDNIKIRLGIIDKKPVRQPRKTSPKAE